jgi:hypothetical protein
LWLAGAALRVTVLAMPPVLPLIHRCVKLTRRLSDRGGRMDVADWLKGLGLAQYATAFRKNDITEALLAELTAEDLKDLGVATVGHRRTLLKAIAALSPETASSPLAPSSQPAVAAPDLGPSGGS